MILATSSSSSELTSGVQEVEIVAADEVLGQVHESHDERLITVMMGRVFADITNQLADL